LPCHDAQHWERVRAAFAGGVTSSADLIKCLGQYSTVRRVDGLQYALKVLDEQAFYSKTLPNIVAKALALPDLVLRHSTLPGLLTMMRPGRRAKQTIPRDLGESLLANMFLCTFEQVYEDLDDSMPDSSFRHLLSSTAPQESAKLQMFVHFFERTADAPLRGEIVIERVVGVALEQEEWLLSKMPLMPVDMAEKGVGFETALGLAHADFANMYIGGGVLSGGCVQEEIRFAICPELCLSMLFCPRMRHDEAIQILGAEQFSAYTGYASSLRYKSDHVDESARKPDGSVLTNVLAMDALDLRGLSKQLSDQMRPEPMLRDLNKALAAFSPVCEESLKQFPTIATGNWGCGAFGGFAPLKALVQWASASQCGRSLRYFPFEQDFGPEFAALSRDFSKAGVTVGQLLSSLWLLRPASEQATEAGDKSGLYDLLRKRGQELIKPAEWYADASFQLDENPKQMFKMVVKAHSRS